MKDCDTFAASFDADVSGIAYARESTQTCILSLKVISNLSVYQYWIKSFYCFQKSGWWCNCGKSKGDMVCQYHRLCWQRMSAFQIYYCYFEQISSHFAFFPIAQTTLIVIPHSSCSQSLTMGRWKGWDSQGWTINLPVYKVSYGRFHGMKH